MIGLWGKVLRGYMALGMVGWAGCLPLTDLDLQLPPLVTDVPSAGTETSPTTVLPPSPTVVPTTPLAPTPGSTPPILGTAAEGTPTGEADVSPSPAQPTGVGPSPTPWLTPLVTGVISPTPGLTPTGEITATWAPTPTVVPTPTGSPGPVLTPTPVPTPTRPPDRDGDGSPDVLDCEPNDPAAYPGAEPVCDVVDNDCDPVTPDVEANWYADSDGDTYGNGDNVLSGCEQPEGYVSNDDDCNDADASIHPNTEWYVDSDDDGFGDSTLPSEAQCKQPDGYVMVDGDCNDEDSDYNPAALETECDDSNDYNCDGSVVFADGDEDGYAACLECNDKDPTVHPGAEEGCDTVDSDCDGDIVDDFEDIDEDGRPDCVDGCVPLRLRYPIESAACELKVKGMTVNGKPAGISMKAGQRMDIILDYEIGGCSCSGCYSQFQAAFVGSWAVCVYNGVPTCNPATSKRWTSSDYYAPNTSGLYNIVMDRDDKPLGCVVTPYWGECTGAEPSDRPPIYSVCVE